MKSLMILAAVLIAGSLMATAGSMTSCTNNALNTPLGCSGSCTNKFVTECGKSCTNKISINMQLSCSGSCTNKFFTECGKSCTNKFTISLMEKTLGCTNQMTAIKI